MNKEETEELAERIASGTTRTLLLDGHFGLAIAKALLSKGFHQCDSSSYCASASLEFHLMNKDRLAVRIIESTWVGPFTDITVQKSRR